MAGYPKHTKCFVVQTHLCSSERVESQSRWKLTSLGSSAPWQILEALVAHILVSPAAGGTV